MQSVVADVGGTNIRLAVCDLLTGEMSKLREIPCAEFLTIDAAFVQYFASLNMKIDNLCIAIACPVEGDQISMTNRNWTFSKEALKEKLNLENLHVINDYTAISLAVPFLKADDKVKIGGGKQVEFGTTAIFGPGTGLGVGHITYVNDKWISLDGEGGHTSLASYTREHADVLLLLQEQFGHVSAERVLAGQGLVNIYHALCRLDGKQPEFHEAKYVTQSALDKSCPIAEKTLNIFCEIAGGFGGNLALNMACVGGVYIAGGIMPRFVDMLLESDFRTFFEAKGRFSEYLKGIPTYLITHDNPGLLGACVYLRQELK